MSNLFVPKPNTLEVRPLTQTDIELIINYWLKSNHEHLLYMGVDINKLPNRSQFQKMLLAQINASDLDKKSFALIAFVNDKAIGHCNLNPLNHGQDGTMHLHIWDKQNRKQGFGSIMVKKSIQFFFERFNLQTIYCEPNAKNRGANQTLIQIGFEFIKSYYTIPGSINFRQEVCRYRLLKENFIIGEI